MISAVQTTDDSTILANLTFFSVCAAVLTVASAQHILDVHTTGHR